MTAVSRRRPMSARPTAVEAVPNPGFGNVDEWVSHRRSQTTVATAHHLDPGCGPEKTLELGRYGMIQVFWRANVNKRVPDLR
jgi:hypothetical protein